MRRWPALLLLASGCSEEGTAAGDPEEPGAPLPYVFHDVTERSGLGSFRQVSGASDKPFIVETIGGGVALVDVDRDGDLDKADGRERDRAD